MLEIKKLECKEDLEKLCRGDVVILSLGSGKIYDEKEYYGIAIFIGKSLSDKWYGYDFCRPQANTKCLIRYHILKENRIKKENGEILVEDNIIITKDGEISSKDFYTGGGNDPKIIKDSGLK